MLKVNRNVDADALLEGLTDLYNLPEVFRLTYAEMKEKFKVHIYLDGDSKTFYQVPRKLMGKYASECYFLECL